MSAYSKRVRDAMFEDAQEALVQAIRATLITRQDDPLTITFVLVHESSAAVHAAVVEQGGTDCGDGFALAVGDRSMATDAPLAGISRDQIACMISIDGHHQALGIPVEVLGDLKLARHLATMGEDD